MSTEIVQRESKRRTKLRAEQVTDANTRAALARKTEQHATRPIRGPPHWNNVQPAILRIGAVQQRTGLSRSSIYRLMEGDPSFPIPLRLGPRTMGWSAEAIDAWIAARPPTRQARLQREPEQADL